MATKNSFHFDLKDLITKFTNRALKEKPKNLEKFAADYFKELYISISGNFQAKSTQTDFQINPSKYFGEIPL